MRRLSKCVGRHRKRSWRMPRQFFQYYLSHGILPMWTRVLSHQLQAPKPHEAAAIAAASHGQSLNQWVAETLEHAATA
ncbi:toxin-antitoxin system HicB family antitoxin [Pandoraea faecigallinarum]|uniref:toxin-antitoxin system HicB family antitoxin n=1 Tax=Pandoraea faecigallinarum TaxID=656179 RepID=UPI000A066AC5